MAFGGLAPRKIVCRAYSAWAHIVGGSWGSASLHPRLPSLRAFGAQVDAPTLRRECGASNLNFIKIAPAGSGNAISYRSMC
jgi:hypothetical protein